MSIEGCCEHGLFQVLIDQLADHVYVKDGSGRYQVDNLAHRHFLGAEFPEQVRGRTVFDFFPAELASRYERDDDEVIRTGRMLAGREEPIVDARGNRRWVSTTKIPLRDPQGNVTGLLGLGRDITDHKVAEEQLSRLHAELERSRRALTDLTLQLSQVEKLESVGRLAAGVAHDVKNPLAVMLMGLEYLARGADVAAPESAAVIKLMRDAVQRADAIIRGLMDFSAARRLEIRPQDPNAVVRQAMKLVQHEMTASKVKPSLELAEELPPVPLDSNKMEQVLVNVLMNAIHAMPRGGLLRVRTFEKTGGDGAVVTEVEDTGAGIPPDKLARVFDPFFTTKPPGKGTGLGLTVSRKIVELHNGTIDIRNRPEGGVAVCIVLPNGRSVSCARSES